MKSGEYSRAGEATRLEQDAILYQSMQTQLNALVRSFRGNLIDKNMFNLLLLTSGLAQSSDALNQTISSLGKSDPRNQHTDDK